MRWAQAPRAVQETKRSIHEIACGKYDAQRQRDRGHPSRASNNFAEGRAAFAPRCKPLVSGR